METCGLYTMTSVTVSHQILWAVELIRGQSIQFLGDRRAVMDLQVEAAISRCLGLRVIAVTLLARVSVAFEDLCPQVLRVNPLSWVSTVLFLGGDKAVLAGLQLRIIDVGFNRPSELVAQFSQSPGALFDLADILDLVATQHFTYVRLEERQDPVSGAAVELPYRMQPFPVRRALSVGLGVAQAVSVVLLLNVVALLHTELSNSSRPFLNAADRGDFFTLDPSSDVGVEVLANDRACALAVTCAWLPAEVSQDEDSEPRDDFVELVSRLWVVEIGRNLVDSSGQALEFRRSVESIGHRPILTPTVGLCA